MTNDQTKTIGLAMAITIGLNAVIGAGIFGVPAALRLAAGPAGIITYLFVIAAILSIALAFARLVATRPTDQLFYTYAALWAGHAGGVCATLSYTIGLAAALGLIATIAGTYLTVFIPFFAPGQWGVILLLGLALLNTLGAVVAKMGQVVLLVLTLVPMGVIALLCATNAAWDNLVPFAPMGLTGILGAIPIVVFGFFGFEAIPSLVTHMKNPTRTVPYALVATVLITGLVYLLFIMSIFAGIPGAFFPTAGTTLPSALLAVFPQYSWLVGLVNWTIIITIAGTIHAMLWSVSSLLVQTSTRLGFPEPISFALALKLLVTGSCVACMLATNLDFLFGLVALAIVFAYGLSIVPLVQKDFTGGRGHRLLGVSALASAVVIMGCAVYTMVGS